MVCGIAQEISNSGTIPIHKAFEFGEVYSYTRAVTRVMMVFFTFLLVLGGIVWGGYSYSTSPITEGVIFTSMGGLGMLATIWGMKRVDGASEMVNHKIRLTHQNKHKQLTPTDALDENWFWNVTSMADKVREEYPAYYVEFGKQYGMARSFTRTLGLIFICTLIIGIYANIYPDLGLSAAASYSISAVSLAACIYFSREIDGAVDKVLPALRASFQRDNT